MNPVIRRSLPASVKRLLTDIAPKEQEWTDPVPEAEPVARDGILLPTRGAGKEEFLSPATIQQEEAAEEASNTWARRPVCTLCKCKPSNYTCPRCNLQYCGLSCYQSPEHSACSEEFYKESVMQELKGMGKTEAEGRRRMQEILLGLRNKADATGGGMESLLQEADVAGEGDAAEKAQVLELLSKLAQLQQSGGENVPEMEAVVRKLEEIGGAGSTPGAAGEGAEGADVEPDLAERLSGLDIDRLSEEELWELLGKEEREKFVGLLKGGGLGGLVPLWTPWWEEHEEEGRPLIEVLREEDSGDGVKMSQGDGERGELASETSEAGAGKKRDAGKRKGRVPSVSANIPEMSSLCANPSPLVCYSLVNALYGYAFSLSLFNGDADSLALEFCDTTLSLSEALNSGRVFSSVREALDAAEALVLRHGYLDAEDPLAPARAAEAVAHIMTGRERRDASGYCLAALSQLRGALSKARATLSKEGEEGTRRRKYFQASKKCAFLQAWAKDNVEQVHGLAVQLWSEHSSRERARSGVERAKTVVEENLRKGKRKRNDKLIEELS